MPHGTMEVAASVASSASYVQQQGFLFRWTIEHFQEMLWSEQHQSTEPKEILTSEVQQVVFESQGIEYQLKARFPCIRYGGIYWDEDRLSMRFDFDLDDNGAEVTCNFVSVTIKSSMGQDYTRAIRNGPISEVVDIGAGEFTDIIDMKKLMSRRDDLLPNDKLTLICQGDFEMDLRQFKIPEPNLLSNFEGILQSGSGSDAVLVAQRKEFLVHRVVLQARSPVFEAMFNHDTTEKRTGRVVIEDIDAPVVEAMIRFIYTDEEPPNLPEVAIDLMVAAGMYDLERLQSMCERQLAITLNLGNVMSLLDLSIHHSCPRLKGACSTFAVLNYPALRNAPHWERTMAQEYPDALDEVLECMLGPHKIDTQEDGERMMVSAKKDSLVRYEQRQKLRFVWTIDHFKEKMSNGQKGKKLTTLTSPVYLFTFGTNVMKFHLKAKIPCDSNDGFQEYESFGLYLYYDPDDQGHDLTPHSCSVAMKSANYFDINQHMPPGQVFHAASDSVPAWRFYSLNSMKQLMSSRRKDMFPNNTMTITCQGKFGMDLRKFQVNESKFMINFEGILQSGSGSDAVLVAQRKEFRVHRVVLQARSPVFEDMLNHDTTEKKTGRVVIENIDPPVVEAMIRFIYTDEEPSNLPEIATDLMVAAGRYGLERLQSMCERHLASTINMGNIVNLLDLSIRNNCPRLRRACSTFAKLNSSKMKNASNWGRKMVQKFPHAMEELLWTT